MAQVSRSRVIEAPPNGVWELVADPHSLPRWWPRAMRVEDVHGHGERSRWTLVLQSDRGAGVRADFRCSASTEGRRLVWEQQIEGTAFERILHSAQVEIRLDPEVTAASAATRLQLTSSESLRGFARLGGAMMRGAARRRLDEALDGVERALLGEPEA